MALTLRGSSIVSFLACASTPRMRRTPVWLVAAVLGLAVGATATIAVIVNALVFNPIPVPHPERLVVLGGLAHGAGLDDPAEYRSHTKGLESIALYRTGDIPVGEEAAGRWTRAAEISGGFFRVFRTYPVMGRAINHEDEPQSVDVVVVSDSFWRTRLFGRKDVLDCHVRLGDRLDTVVGIAPRGFDFPPGTQAWIPRARLENRRPTLVEGASELAVVRRPSGWVARLRDDSSPQQVQSQLEALLAHANETLSETTGVRYGEIVDVAPLVESMSRGFQPTLLTLMAGAAIVLMVATTNCALFALAISARGRTELAVRQVLGASPGRIGRHMIGQAATVGAVAGLLGLLVSVVLLRIAEQSLHAFGVELNARPAAALAALGLSLLLGLLSGLIGGILPALRVRRHDIVASLNSFAASSFGDRDRTFRRGFTVVQVCAAVVLSIGAMVTVRTLVTLDSRDLGQNWSDVAVVRLWMPREGLQGADMGAVQRDLLDETRSLPGVIAAASVDRVTIESRDRGFRQVLAEGGGAMAAVVQIAGDYFRVTETRIVKGHAPASADRFGAVVNETLARALWAAGVSPIGQSLRLSGQPTMVVNRGGAGHADSGPDSHDGS